MNAITRTVSVAVLVALSLALEAWAAEPLPYGHAAFVPTPERPLGFRGDGNGWFPGATPVLEFFEGTPTKTEQTIVDRSGSQKKAQVWTYADRHTKNVLWKTGLPGWNSLLARYLAVATGTPWRNWLWQPERSERGRIERTFAALARVAVPRLRAALATAKTAPEKDALTKALAACGVTTP